MQPEARFFADRGIGSRIVPDGLRAAGWVVTTMDERYGALTSQTIADDVWIRDAATSGDIILAKDRAIARRPAEAQAIYYTEARALVSANAQITGPELLRRLLKVAPAIEGILRAAGPWVYGVYESRIERVRLGFPPR